MGVTTFSCSYCWGHFDLESSLRFVDGGGYNECLDCHIKNGKEDEHDNEEV